MQNEKCKKTESTVISYRLFLCFKRPFYPNCSCLTQLCTFYKKKTESKSFIIAKTYDLRYLEATDEISAKNEVVVFCHISQTIIVSNRT